MRVSNSQAFQEELLNLILRDSTFSLRFHSIVIKDIDLKKQETKLFKNPLIDKTVSIFFDLMDRSNGIHPSRGLLENEIHRSQMSVEDKTSILKLIEKAWESKLVQPQQIEEEIVRVLQAVKSVVVYKESAKLFSSSDIDEVLKFKPMMEKFIDGVNKINLSRRDEVDITNILRVIDEASSLVMSNIPFGVPEIDSRINGGGKFGGIARGEVTIVEAAVNGGKSLITLSFEANAIRNGFKGVHINLEGRRYQPALRLISNLTKIPHKHISRLRDFKSDNPALTAKDYFNSEELGRIAEAETIIKNLRMFHEVADCEIGSVISVIKDAYLENPFDFAVIDYAMLLTATHVKEAKHEVMAYIFRQLEILAAELNIAIITPMQVNRSGLSELKNDAKTGLKYPIYTLDHVADSKKAIDTAGLVISYSATVEEKIAGRGRFAIIKQREGDTLFQVGIVSNWSCQNLFEGQRYYQGFGDLEGTSTQKNDNFDNAQKKLETLEKKMDLPLDKKYRANLLIPYFDAMNKKFAEILQKKKEIEYFDIDPKVPEEFSEMSNDEYLQKMKHDLEEMYENTDRFVSEQDDGTIAEASEAIKDIQYHNKLKFQKDELLAQLYQVMKTSHEIGLIEILPD